MVRLESWTDKNKLQQSSLAQQAMRHRQDTSLDFTLTAYSHNDLIVFPHHAAVVSQTQHYFMYAFLNYCSILFLIL